MAPTTGTRSWLCFPLRSTQRHDSLNRLTHEYGLKDDLDDAWAARPVALTHYNDRAISTSRPRWAKRPEAITSAQSWQVEKRGGPR
jgi:hypothetical protein